MSINVSQLIPGYEDEGNSKGLRLSKTIIEKYAIKDKVEFILKEDCIELRPITNPREGWAEQFQRMSKNGDDNLMINDLFDDETFEEWK
jgi:antitoxin MazE